MVLLASEEKIDWDGGNVLDCAALCTVVVTNTLYRPTASRAARRLRMAGTTKEERGPGTSSLPAMIPLTGMLEYGMALVAIQLTAALGSPEMDWRSSFRTPTTTEKAAPLPVAARRVARTWGLGS